ncbi:MAG: plastocyanin/azurin family copper-binding protein [Nitrosotalea sp.]
MMSFALSRSILNIIFREYLIKPNRTIFHILVLTIAYTLFIIYITEPAYATTAQVTISRGASMTSGTCSATSCFDPQVININTGDTVTWTNNDTVGHTSTSGRPQDNLTGTIWDSSLIRARGTYTSPPFVTAGTYNYFCQVHPWMAAQVIVGSTSGTGVTVTTDKLSYNYGDTIVISGQVQTVVAQTPLSIFIYDPNANVIKIVQINVSSGGTFTASFLALGPLWKTSGTYTVKVQYGPPSITAQTTFAFIVPNPPPSVPEFPLGGMVLLAIASMAVYIGIRYKTFKTYSNIRGLS